MLLPCCSRTVSRFPSSFQAAAGFALCSQHGTWLPMVTLDNLKAGGRGKGWHLRKAHPADHTPVQNHTEQWHQADSNHGNWEAVSFNRSPILTLPTCGIHIQILSTVRKKKEGKKGVLLLLLRFSSKNIFFAIKLKKAILHHGYLYTSFGKIL